MRSLIPGLLLFLAFATSAFASDGVLEINQTCAVQTGCFAGDAAGLPVTITASGSYRLTSSLSVPNENTDGIDVGASDVSLDLGGFAIGGPNHCSAPPVACQLSGGGFGIHGTADHLHVSNGSIVGHGGVGIYSESGEGHAIRDVETAHNRYEGIRIDGGAAMLEGITAMRNGKHGILVGVSASVSDSTAYQNGEMGIRAEAGSTLWNNTAYGNGTYGISAGVGSTVQGNTARSNDGIGLALSTQTAYRDNTISSSGITVLGGINAGGNVCNGLLTCP